jgi:hypothetical protein
MSPLSRRKLRIIGLALALFAAAAWLGPGFLSAERYRHRLEEGLARVLKRPVTFSSASLRLLPRPGFSLQNAVIHEDPAFGSEPFARAERLDGDLRWSSLWHARLDFARLRMERPSFNIVRNDRGEWNVEKLLLESGVASAGSGQRAQATVASPFEVEADEGRLNFKIGTDKKPLAILDLRARLRFDAARGLVEYRLEGNPVRSDRSTPPPGNLELVGEWKPGADLGGTLRARLRTRDALLYNWVPLVTDANPEVYGVLDADVRLAGSLRVIKIEGEARVAQLHRWEILPPAEPMPIAVYFRGEFDRTRGLATLASLDASFRESRVHVSGAVDRIPSAPDLDLVVAIERSRLEDFVAVARRLWGAEGGLGLAGRVDGLMSVQGPWAERRYGGFLDARGVSLQTPSGSFALSELALRIDKDGARLAPVRVALAPRVEVVAEGALYRQAPAGKNRRKTAAPHYEVRVSAKAVDLREVVRFAGALGFPAVKGLDARGAGTAAFVLAGSAWPLTRPSLSGRAEIRAARLLVPGLTEPVNIPRARIQVSDDHLVVDPVTAVMGTSVFTGRLEHQGERKNPWRFEVKANSLSLEQGALWFDALGHRPPLPLLERIPGLGSASARRSVASGLFGALNAQGRFESPRVSFRSLSLEDFRAVVAVSGRVVEIGDASFRVGGGRGKGRAAVDLTSAPARIQGSVTLAGAHLQSLSRHLPAALRGARASVSGSATFATRGLTRGEMSAGLEARGTAQLKNVLFGDFDPLQSLVRQAHWGELEPTRREVALGEANVDFTIRDRRLTIVRQALELEGARLQLTGGLGFQGDLELDVSADLRHMTRRWAETGVERPSLPRPTRLHLAGPLYQPVVRTEGGISQASR